MPVSYDKLPKIRIDKKMKSLELKNVSGISFNVLKDSQWETKAMEEKSANIGANKSEHKVQKNLKEIEMV